MASVPPNVHVSNHPCLRAKLSQLRSKSVSARDVKSLIHELSVIVACEALATAITAVDGPQVKSFPPPFECRDRDNADTNEMQDETPLGFKFTTTTVQPNTMCIVPVLRSGLGMVEGGWTGSCDLPSDPVSSHLLSRCPDDSSQPCSCSPPWHVPRTLHARPR